MPWLPYTTGHDLRKSGKRGGLPREALAEKVDLTPQYLSRLEAGHQSPSVETVANLADALYVELWELFDLGHQGSVREVRVRLRKWIQELSEEDRPAAQERRLSGTGHDAPASRGSDALQGTD